jgi:predicted transcriptional regulator
MITNGTSKPDLASQITKILNEEPGLSVKELAERLKTNRQFMAGVLKVLEEHQEVSCRQVGPARIYFVHPSNKGSLNNGDQEI